MNDVQCDNVLVNDQASVLVRPKVQLKEFGDYQGNTGTTLFSFPVSSHAI